MTASLLIHRHPAAAIAVAALTFGVTGCLSVPEGTAPMCRSSSDCDTAHGEVCEQEVCWGNPPAGPFAAVVTPPSTRRDLAFRELALVTIDPDGRFADLVLEAPVPLTGAISIAPPSCPPPTACAPPAPFGATVTVSVPSQFAGGPGFKTSVAVAAGVESFSIPVPRTDQPYTVTLIPERTADTMTSSTGSPSAPRSPGEQFPPLRKMVTAGGGLLTFELGAPGLQVISGALTSDTGVLANYRVVALGRWEPSEPLSEVSSIAVTDAAGAYQIVLSDGLSGTVELVARPADSKVAPTTLHIANIDPTKSSLRSAAAPAGLGTTVAVTIKVEGADLNGRIGPVAGATVSVSGAVSSGSASFTLSDQKVTNDQGVVQLTLLDGDAIAGTYRLSIIPPVSSTLGVLFDQPFALSDTLKRLPQRLALRGEVIDSAGKPVSNVAITARPALRFLWTLDTAPQAFAAAIPAATVATLDNGVFVLWVDPMVADTLGQYELVVEPAVSQAELSYVSRFVSPSISLQPLIADPAAGIAPITLPDAAFVHGRVTTASGEPVDSAEVKIYTLSSEAGLCNEVGHAPASCPIPAALQGRNTTDTKGAIELALPRL